MEFKKLIQKIGQAPNKKSFLGPVSDFRNDSFRITSSLYSNDIYCNNVMSVNDIYNVVNDYQLDPQLFDNLFFITVIFKSFNEKTINIINELNNSIFIRIITIESIDSDKLRLLSKIKHKNCRFYSNGSIKHDTVGALFDIFNIDSECSPILVIDKIDSSTIDKINIFCEKINKPRFKIEIKDLYSLKNLYNIIPYIPEDEILVLLDDQLFNEKNPNNARDLIVQNHDERMLQGKKLNVCFRKIRYENINQIYGLERQLELIKSHIPSNASELDIVTYISLFIINYFKYDYDMYEKNKNKEDFDDININEFISNGKGVCRHFASFTEYILNSLGIECERIDSLENNYLELEGHSFNIVKIAGKRYFLDTTWLADSIQAGEIQSLAESSDFLRSNANFGHEEYEDTLSNYQCEDYDRLEINSSVNRVLNWKNNYKIHPTALGDLFRKHMLEKEKKLVEKIEDAIPGRR